LRENNNAIKIAENVHWRIKMAEEFDLYDSLNNPDNEWREGYTMHTAQFTMADDETLNKLRKVVGEAGYFDNIMLYELRKIDPSETFRLKLYEALYFLLNGTRRAIWGGNCFFSDGSELDFDPFEEFSINRNADLPEIVKELENVNINELEENFDLEIFKKVNLYPRLVWNECTREELLKALSKSYYGGFLQKSKREECQCDNRVIWILSILRGRFRD
jgi:hypothetical protein